MLEMPGYLETILSNFLLYRLENKGQNKEILQSPTAL